MESTPELAWVAIDSLSRVKELQRVLKDEGIASQMLPPPQEHRG